MDDQETYIRNLGTNLADQLIESTFYRPNLGGTPIKKVFLFGTGIENMLAVSHYIQERLEEKYSSLADDSSGNKESAIRLFDLSRGMEIIFGQSFELPKDAGDDASFPEYPINLYSYFDEKGLPAKIKSPDGKLVLRTL